MFKNIIVIPPGWTVGDSASVIGLVYYLLNFYEKVHFNITNEYFSYFFKNDPLFNKRIFLVPDVNSILERQESELFHVCNVHTANWQSPSFHFYDHPKIDKAYYFNDLQPLYEKLPIQDLYKSSQKIHLQHNRPELEINHLIYYKLVGLNNKVRMDFFNYVRSLEDEIKIKHDLFKVLNLRTDQEYIVANCPVGSDHVGVESLSEFVPRISRDLPVINIHNLTNFPGLLTKLLEDASEIHFVEGSNVNFFYHCQYKNIFRYQKNIYLHRWARNRNWPEYNLDFAWKMYDTPFLDNWVILD